MNKQWTTFTGPLTKQKLKQYFPWKKYQRRKRAEKFTIELGTFIPIYRSCIPADRFDFIRRELDFTRQAFDFIRRELDFFRQKFEFIRQALDLYRLHEFRTSLSIIYSLHYGTQPLLRYFMQIFDWIGVNFVWDWFSFNSGTFHLTPRMKPINRAIGCVWYLLLVFSLESQVDAKCTSYILVFAY